MCHSRFYHGPGVSAHGFPSPHGSPEENTREEIPAHSRPIAGASGSIVGVSPSGDSGQGFLTFPLPESPQSDKEAPAHFHVLENGSIWKFRDKLGRFCKPYRQRVKVCVVCEEIWENSAKEEK